uniref:Membrane protein n=1 Tax=Pithovirus LCPAC304 TaxID=2506594 RepID=A0A481ZB66_9VIRU|nr:MAG: membrane protein [Pithovirus LCPAC304]
MSKTSVYTLSSGMEDRVKKSMKFYSGNKMDKPCEVSRVRVCKPLKTCHDVVTSTHMEEASCDDGEMDHHHHGYSSIGWAVLWFIIIAVIVWLIIFSLKPAWALNEDGDVDTGKVLLASIVIALIIVIIIWIIYAACSGGFH